MQTRYFKAEEIIMVNKELNFIHQVGNTNKDTESESDKKSRMEIEGSAHTWAA